ncbi:MAG: hypothetical protein JJU29_06310 [Verrucomicrobia bacterium]|nr:hypothetical protein [Verrucomicrobiota bacterium]MCH8511480.1 hypothetical protein [Kiritimatiellia bacterium]
MKDLKMEAPPTEPSGRRLKPGVVALALRSPAENSSERSQYRIIRAAEMVSQAD